MFCFDGVECLKFKIVDFCFFLFRSWAVLFVCLFVAVFFFTPLSYKIFAEFVFYYFNLDLN